MLPTRLAGYIKNNNPSFIYNSIQLAHSDCCPYSCPEPDPWVQRASELGLVPVDEISLVVCDAVKGQNPCMLVQIDANPSGLRWAQQFFLAIVPEGEPVPGPVQAPGQSIVSQTAFVIRTLAFHLLVGHANGDLHGGTGKNLIRKGSKSWWLQIFIYCKLQGSVTWYNLGIFWWKSVKSKNNEHLYIQRLTKGWEI